MTALYALRYERRPKSVDGDVAVVETGDAATVVTSSAFRLLEARRTDRPMSGPYASLDVALAVYSPSIR